MLKFGAPIWGIVVFTQVQCTKWWLLDLIAVCDVRVPFPLLDDRRSSIHTGPICNRKLKEPVNELI
jgi:hypothetical protein